MKTIQTSSRIFQARNISPIQVMGYQNLLEQMKVSISNGLDLAYNTLLQAVKPPEGNITQALEERLENWLNDPPNRMVEHYLNQVIETLHGVPATKIKDVALLILVTADSHVVKQSGRPDVDKVFDDAIKIINSGETI